MLRAQRLESRWSKIGRRSDDDPKEPQQDTNLFFLLRRLIICCGHQPGESPHCGIPDRPTGLFGPVTSVLRLPDLEHGIGVHLILRLHAANIDGTSSCYLMGFVRGLFVHRLGKNNSDALDDQLRIIFLYVVLAVCRDDEFSFR